MTPAPSSNRCRGLSLIEMSLVIAIMLVLSSIVIYSMGSMGEWKAGRKAGESLKSVYMAQKSYLADHPADSYSSLTSAKLIPYLPGGDTALPAAKTLDDGALTLDITVMPPEFKNGGTVYDPSKTRSDGLWDTGGL